MEDTFSMSLALCAGNSLVIGEFPSQRPVMWSFDVFFDLCLIKGLSKQLNHETGDLRLHCAHFHVIVMNKMKDLSTNNTIKIWRDIEKSPIHFSLLLFLRVQISFWHYNDYFPVWPIWKSILWLLGYGIRNKSMPIFTNILNSLWWHAASW